MLCLNGSIVCVHISLAEFPESGGRVGLVNLGNTCFMNSMLQCLGQTGEMARVFLNMDTPPPSKSLVRGTCVSSLRIFSKKNFNSVRLFLLCVCVCAHEHTHTHTHSLSLSPSLRLAYKELMQQMWRATGNSSNMLSWSTPPTALCPRTLKDTFSRRNPQFSGFKSVQCNICNVQTIEWMLLKKDTSL